MVNLTPELTLKVLVMTIDAQWEGMGDVGSARYEPALLPPCPTIRVLSYSNYSIFGNSALYGLHYATIAILKLSATWVSYYLHARG